MREVFSTSWAERRLAFGTSGEALGQERRPPLQEVMAGQVGFIPWECFHNINVGHFHNAMGAPNSAL